MELTWLDITAAILGGDADRDRAAQGGLYVAGLLLCTAVLCYLYKALARKKGGEDKDSGPWWF